MLVNDHSNRKRGLDSRFILKNKFGVLEEVGGLVGGFWHYNSRNFVSLKLHQYIQDNSLTQQGNALRASRASN